MVERATYEDAADLGGDAAYVRPGLGQGVNRALQDAADLAVAISEKPGETLIFKVVPGCPT